MVLPEGRILVGLQASHSNSRQILDALTDIGYECQGLTEDVGYQLFFEVIL